MPRAAVDAQQPRQRAKLRRLIWNCAPHGIRIVQPSGSAPHDGGVGIGQDGQGGQPDQQQARNQPKIARLSPFPFRKTKQAAASSSRSLFLKSISPLLKGELLCL